MDLATRYFWSKQSYQGNLWQHYKLFLEKDKSTWINKETKKWLEMKKIPREDLSMIIDVLGLILSLVGLFIKG